MEGAGDILKVSRARLSSTIDVFSRVGLDLPRIKVRFDPLSVDAETYVGNRAVPTIFNFTVNILEGFLNSLHILPNRKRPLPILHEVSGIVKPGRITLLLGPPGSGKTTLLLTLAGKLDRDLKGYGRVTYNGYGMDEFVPQRTSAYISQNDLHIGELTVRETLAFSARCQGVGARYEMLAELSRREKEANIKPDPDVDIFMKVKTYQQNIQSYAHTSRLFLFVNFDEKCLDVIGFFSQQAASIQGQDASVVTDYILKIRCHFLNYKFNEETFPGIYCSILQILQILGLDICADTLVGDEMFRGISGGQKKRVTAGEMMVGPVVALFMDDISTGLDSSTAFQIVNSIRQSIHILQGTTMISLLQPAPETYDLFDDIVLLSDGQIVFQGPRENVLEFFEYMGFKCPERKGVADFLQEVTSQKDQEQYWANRDEPYNHPAALTTWSYGVSKKELLKGCSAREFLLMKRNSFIYIFKIVQLIIMGFITMALFLRTEMHKNTTTDGGVYLGALLFAVMMIMFNEYSEHALSIVKLPVFYKQRDFLFFPAWAYALPTWILKIPITLVEVFIWVCLTYYVVGFDADIGRFFKQIFLLICVNQMASALFHLLAALGRNLIVANTFGSIALLAVMDNANFLSDDVKKWWIWGYWFSPLMYAQNVVAVNEFLGKSWAHVPPNSTDTLVALTYLNPFVKPQPILSEETVTERIASTRGEVIELSTGERSSLGGHNSHCALVCKNAGGNDLLERGNANMNRKRGMVLPFEPLCIAFDDIRYAEMKAQFIIEDRLELLKGVSGAFRPGVLTALMGITGAELTSLRESVVGLPGVNGLSTEQRKRLTIAVELVANSSIIFMDEPTSGVDARAAAIVMRTVRNTVDTGRTVACTIHQPSIDIFDAFNELLLLKRGGEEIYVGPLDRHSSHLIKYFEGNDGVPKIKDSYNPATWMLEITTAAQEALLGIDYAELYNNSELHKRNKALIKELSVPAPVRLLFTIFVALMFGIIFWDLGSKRGRQQDFFNAIGAMYAAVMFLVVQNSTAVQPIISIERTVFYRERAAGMYSALPYAFGQVQICIPQWIDSDFFKVWNPFDA
ncbi:hypothetical protein RND71_023078 [Anisodus tanguticus]|uniref:ABC transporter domain-containing protein n=1 Tax=Anisodus tanguticus TaxID=243964 RepID=A0AAE1RUY1_9SOLA|nr:hypothetical protein RND71_023078 [Anisodus tanguticus]